VDFAALSVNSGSRVATWAFLQSRPSPTTSAFGAGHRLNLHRFLNQRAADRPRAGACHLKYWIEQFRRAAHSRSEKTAVAS